MLLCCGLAGGLAAGIPASADAQGTPPPFRVDPALLGLPPVSAAPTVRPTAGAAAQTQAVDLSTTDARPLPATGERTAERAGEAPGRAGPARAALAPAVQAPQVPSSAQSAAARSAGEGLPAASAEAPETATTPLQLRLAKSMVAPPKESSEPRPAFLSAQRISGVTDRELLAEDDAELRKLGTVLTADRLTYWPVEDEVEALGNARLQIDEDVISAPKMRLKVEDQVGFADNASYFLRRQANPDKSAAGGAAADKLPAGPAPGDFSSGFAAPRLVDLKPGQTKVKGPKKPVKELTEGRGEAQRIDLEGENQVRLSGATYTTCKPGNDDWMVSARELQLDYDQDVATGSDATIRFMDVPILYSPWVSFSLNNERKSGFLTPTYGSSTESGVEFTLPYYWNIAPNMDATFEPRILTKRGVQLATDVRYMNAAYGGAYFSKARVEMLPNDRVRDLDRWGVALTHTQTTASGFTGSLSFNRVSDDYYYTDLSSQISSTANTQLLQQGQITYGGGGWWNISGMLQTFQTLQPDPRNPVGQPYRLLPQIVVNARQPDLYLTDSAFFVQYSNFTSPEANRVTGQRIVLQPQVSLPYVTPGWYVTPRLGVNITHYSLSQPATAVTAPSSISRNLPIFSVDSGMTFERASRWFGREYTQTLEPRLFYLNIPYRKQDDIPIFDTALADFNFAQIFADNQFSGWDRINNANQLTAATTSRLIDPASGAEIMRAMLGQRLYFADDKVALQPGTATRKWKKSDLLAAFTGQVLPHVYTDATLQYDTGDQQFQRYSFGARYLPEAGKVFNAAYSYNRNAATPIRQIDISGQWPLTSRWQVVGRYNYSFLQNQPIEIIGGVEYNAGCWVLRAVGQRVVTSESHVSTRAYLQLELSDFSRLGANPLVLLQRRIPGYGIANQSLDERAWNE